MPFSKRATVILDSWPMKVLIVVGIVWDLRRSGEALVEEEMADKGRRSNRQAQKGLHHLETLFLPHNLRHRTILSAVDPCFNLTQFLQPLLLLLYRLALGP